MFGVHHRLDRYRCLGSMTDWTGMCLGCMTDWAGMGVSGA